MKKNYCSLILGSIVLFSVFLFAGQVSAKTETTCGLTCPVVHYEWTTKTCPTADSAYTSTNHDKDCSRVFGNGSNKYTRYADKITTNNSAEVAYEKSNDPNKCHRPSDNTLADVYEMDNDAVHDFKDHNSESKDGTPIVCPVNGGWSDWSTKNDTCGFIGNQTRTCTNPTPANGGKDCSSLDGGNNSRQYTNGACPVNGGWAVLDSCPTTPGSPASTLTSTCTNPTPANGGNDCVAPAPTSSCSEIPLQCTANDPLTIVSDVQTLKGGIPAVVVSPLNSGWTALIGGVTTWIWGENPVVDPIGVTTETFTRTFTISGTPKGATLDIAADNSYEVSVNTHSVGADATEFNYTSAGQKTYTIPAENLVSGENIITFVVTNWAQEGGTAESNPAGLLYKLTVNSENCPTPEPKATIVATKVVCDSESDLPNWGAGGSDITSTTATDYVTSHSSQCEITPWTFEWSLDGVGNPGDNSGTGGTGWNAFAGTATIVNPASKIWVREQMKDGYVPFTGANTDQNVSAEMYCSTDVLNYDNWEWIDPVVAGQTYYCVGFNALKTVVPPQCDENQNLVEGKCVSDDDIIDVCANITGDQASIPAGMVVNDAKECVTPPIVCSGEQHLDDGQCVANHRNEEKPKEEPKNYGSNGPAVGSFGMSLGGGSVLGASTSAEEGEALGDSCGLYMEKHIRLGSKKNNIEQVKKLQEFLNKWMNSNIPITGFYGPLTYAQVKAFQAQYGDEILKPWDLTSPTGLVYLSTLRQINNLECPDIMQEQELVPWSQNPHAQD